jgi:hypothetical protein
MRNFMTAFWIMGFLAFVAAADDSVRHLNGMEVEVKTSLIEKYLPGHKVVARLFLPSRQRGVVVTNNANGRESFISEQWDWSQGETDRYGCCPRLSALLAALSIRVPDEKTACEIARLVETLIHAPGKIESEMINREDYTLYRDHPYATEARRSGDWKYTAEQNIDSWIVTISYVGSMASTDTPPIFEICVTKDHCLAQIKQVFLRSPNEKHNLGRASAWIRPASDGSHFVRTDTGAPFTAWGFNYDHDRNSRLLEDYWVDEWQTVLEDFLEMKQLGANAVRLHPQLGRFMNSPTEPNEAALAQLKRLVEYSQEIGLYLDLTGLGCYLKKEVPPWYDALDEAGRWDVQALFWESIAKACAEYPSVLCYDLMNEPVLPGEGEKATEWLAGEFAGMCFVQRLTLDLAGRTREQVAKAWVDRLVAAIRKHDKRHMITVGVIPWNYTFPGAKPIFYSNEVSENLDYVSVHFYPKGGDVENALKALWAYDIGKPLVVEEMFPLECSQEDLAAFIEGSRGRVDGYFGFYWGKTIEESACEQSSLPDQLTHNWLVYFKSKAFEFLGTKPEILR